MYYYIAGELVLIEGNLCVVDCAGVGYQLTASAVTAALLSDKIGQQVRLYSHLAVREDGVELFGFYTPEERTCYHRLTSVSGVGPKVAMSILSTMTPDDLALAIATEDVKAISRAPGIGAKGAARIVLELRDKISKDMLGGATALSGGKKQAVAPVSANLSEAAEALMVLGYDKNRVLSALKDMDPKTEVADMIRLALKELSKR